ncbi:MAG TPA: C25 family cysteine peptidase, partial [Verrucomicrobiae bacterium]|nr:C25 family cysteine peptidase [Verrucomicrobiae bacterium]
GVWVKVSQFGGRDVATLEFPPLDKITGPGIPQKPGERGWYDFPEATGIAPLSPARYEHPFEQGVFKPTFPQSAIGKTPKTEREFIAAGLDPAGGRPGIPTLRGFLAVSRQTTLQDMSVDLSQSTQKEITLPAPLRPAGFTGSDQATADFGYTPPELFDEEFYANFKGSYRGTEAPVDRNGSSGAFGVASVTIPLAELTSASVAKIYTDLVVSVKHLKGTEDFTCLFSWDSWLFNLPFINGAALRDSMTVKGISIEGSRSAHYLILTPRAYRTALDEFARFKQSKGLNVDFAYVGTSATDDVPPDRNAIDAYLESYFKANYCHGVYVLLVGDVDVIPSGRTTRIDSDPDKADADSDHIYEVLGSDRFPSLYVGRLSVNSEGELNNQLAKILSYERNPIAGDWPTKATLAANSQNDDGSRGVSASFPSKYAAAVNAVASYGGYTSSPTFQVLHAGAATASATRAVNQDVVNAIHNGRGIVLYRGHGDGSGWVSGWDGSSTYGLDFTTSHINSLTNRAYPIVFAIACQNGRLRNNDAISELWMSRANGGAVAHFGASVNSYTDENHERAKGLFRAIYEGGFTRLGPILAEGERISYNVTGGGAGWDNNTFAYNLLGDPELTVRRKAVPLNIGVIPVLTLAQSSGTILLLKDSSGGVVSNALVNVILANQTRTNLFTGPTGSLLLQGIKPAEVSTVQVHADGYPYAESDFGTPVQALLKALGFGRTGAFNLTVEGAQGNWVIQASTDLVKWVDVGTIKAGGSSLTDLDAPQFKYRFYRAVSQ